MRDIFEIFVGLLLAVTIIALLARKLRIPYPILFVVGGFLIGWLRHAPEARLNPDLVFLFFLPPLLFPAALFTSWRDFRANLRPISLLAIGLVLFTMIAVALLAHYFMHLPLAVGFALGAIVSPPDAIAATAIAQKLSVPRRIIVILEGESLVNDATALIAYRFAIASVLTGSFSLVDAGAKFCFVSVGGVVIGLVIGWLASQFLKRIEDSPIEITFSLLTPFVAYSFAERLHVSGVLSVVTAGLYIGRRVPEILSYRTRLQAGPVWEIMGFLLNGFVFILIGLQLPGILHQLEAEHDYSVGQLIVYALIISVGVIAVRLLWVFPAAYLPRYFSKKKRDKEPAPDWREIVIIGWTGMRGVVSLAAALALPKDFPARNLILFLTFTVIAATLVAQGLSLAPLIRWLGVKNDDSELNEERKARLLANQAALDELKEIAQKCKEAEQAIQKDVLQRLRVEYEDHMRQIETSESQKLGTSMRIFSLEYEHFSHRALQVERRTLVRLRNENVINDDTLRHIQHDIDLAESRLKS